MNATCRHGILAAFAVCILALFAATGSAAAESTAPRIPYPQAGAPVNPKVPVRFNHYHDYAETTQLLHDLVAAYPDYARLQSLGQSYGGHEMWVLTVTDFSTGPETDKPGMWIDGCIHANEAQATEVVLYTAWYLLETRATSSYSERLLRERVFYLLPILSPDARESHFYEANSANSPRSGLRPVDNDRDGLVDEDSPEDINGDSHITQMRVADPDGRMKPDPDFPDRLIPARPDERGSYRLLGQEGYDNDGDGRVNEDDTGGYDPNRDWGWNWQPAQVQGGAYRYPFSILENRMMADFIRSRPNIAGAQSYHNSGGMILWGPGAENTPFPPGDDRLHAEIGARGAEMLPAYRPMVIWKDLYTVYGGTVDWLYFCNGVLTFTNELFTSYDYFHSTEGTENWQGSRADPFKFDKLLLFEQGHVPWEEVDHPQFGKVEVGGRKKSWGRQPPSFMLEEECHRNMAFSLYHADQLPLLNIREVSSRALPGGLTEITAAVANARMAPSRLEIDVQQGLTRPDRVTLCSADGAPVEVAAAYWSSERFFERPTEQQRRPRAVIEVPAVPGMGAVYCRWLVQGSGPFTVSLDSVKGGKDSAAVAQGS